MSEFEHGSSEHVSDDELDEAAELGRALEGDLEPKNFALLRAQVLEHADEHAARTAKKDASSARKSFWAWLPLPLTAGLGLLFWLSPLSSEKEPASPRAGEVQLASRAEESAKSKAASVKDVARAEDSAAAVVSAAAPAGAAESGGSAPGAAESGGSAPGAAESGGSAPSAAVLVGSAPGAAVLVGSAPGAELVQAQARWIQARVAQEAPEEAQDAFEIEMRGYRQRLLARLETGQRAKFRGDP